MAPRKNHTTSARLIFSRDEYNIYLEFQKHTSPWQDSGRIGSAVDYRAFRYFSIHQRSNTNQQAQPSSVAKNGTSRARKCGHTLHPSHGTSFKQEYCTVCTVTWNLEFLEVLQVAWDQCGGPWEVSDIRVKWDGHADRVAHCRSIANVWRRAKIDLSNELIQLHNMAEKERQWEIQHPEYPVAGNGCFAARAIEIANQRSADPTMYLTKAQSRELYKNNEWSHEYSASSRNVTFEPESNDKDMVGATFRAMMSPLMDFVLKKQKSEVEKYSYDRFYEIRQLKVYAVENSDELWALKSYPERIPDISEGSSALHKYWNEIGKAASNIKVGRDIRKWRNADAVVVLVLDGRVNKVLPMCIEKDENIPACSRPRTTVWTRHSEFA